ncbi:MAG: hypothetical protein AAAFM81_11235 [Pseudomonadota bacterium]
MFKALRIFILMTILVVVAGNAWLTHQRTTDWNTSLWVRVYPINADGEAATGQHIRELSDKDFTSVEQFLAREAKRYGVATPEVVRIDLGPEIFEQPPEVGDNPNVFAIMAWSLKMRWWAGSVSDKLEDYTPDVRIFVRYHQPSTHLRLDDSVGVSKGKFGIVNAYTERRYRESNNVVLAHELLHTIGASDKYERGSGLPLPPDGLGEPDRRPLYPQRLAEIMGGRVALSATQAEMPRSLKEVVVGPATAKEIGLISD